MTKSELAYKQDTGFDPTFCVKSDSDVLDEDCPYKEDCCRVDDFPNEYVIGNDVYIPDPSYIRWLEEKVEELLNQK